MATPFLYAKKAGSDADGIVTFIPRPPQMPPHLPGADKKNREKKRQGAPPEPHSAPDYFSFS